MQDVYVSLGYIVYLFLMASSMAVQFDMRPTISIEIRYMYSSIIDVTICAILLPI